MLFCLLAWLLLLAVAPRAALAQFTHFQPFAEAQGLTNQSVTALLQDPDGYIMLGTESGLFRYDGQSIARYGTTAGLPGGRWIRSLQRDRYGQVWAVVSDGVYRRVQGRFQPVDLGGARLHAGGPMLLALLDDAVVLDVGGRLLRAPLGQGGVGRFDPMPNASAPPARFAAADGDGVLFGCDTGLCRAAADGRVTLFGAAAGLPPDAWQAALRTPDGTLWTRSVTRLAWRSPGAPAFRSVIIPGSHESYLAEHPVLLTLGADGKGGIFTQGDDGLLRWRGAGLGWKTYGHHEGGIPAAAILSFLMDREGALWLGTAGYGAARSLGLDSWEHWTQEDGLAANAVWSVARVPDGPPAQSARPSGAGTLWLGLEGGSMPLDQSAAPIPGTSYVAAVSRGGRLWLAPYNSDLVRIDPGREGRDRFSAPDKVQTAVIDRGNRLWFSTASGVFMFPDADAGPAGPEASPRLVLPVSDVAALYAAPDGAIWIAGTEGAFRWRETDGLVRMVAPGQIAGTPTAIGMTASDELWIASESRGLLRFASVGGRRVPVRAPQDDVLADSTLLLIHRDRRDRMWVGSGAGIALWDGNGWRHFGTAEGLISNDVNQSAVYEDADGSMWFGTSHGLSHLIDPDHLPPLPPLRPPLVTEVSLGDETLHLDHPAPLRWTRGPLRIRFDDLNFTYGSAMRFRYRVEGIDTSWNETSERVIQYAAPPTGLLRLTLIGLGPYGNVMSPPVNLRIVIRTPWWRQPLFLLLLTLLASALLLAIWRLRERFLLLRQARLEEMIGERTREIEQARAAFASHAAQEQHRLEDMVERRTFEIQQARAELQRLAMSDALTGLPNRRALMLSLEHAVREVQSAAQERAAAPGTRPPLLPLAVLLCDLDHFKAVNDRHGHLAGDQVLAAFGGRLASCLEAGEIAGRYGGEEFLVVLRGDAAAVQARLDDIRATLARLPYRLGDVEKIITFSGGLALLRPLDSVVSLVARADDALYRAKENGRARIEVEREGQSPPRTSTAGWDVLLERDLRAALQRDEFSLHFQPVADVARDVVTSCEALLRWTSPSRGAVSPATFIPFAERHGLMEAIDGWVLRKACAAATTWPKSVRLSVNLSPTHFYRASLVDDIRAVLAETRLPAARLELEVTETTMIANIAGAAEVLARLRTLGISIALDDFGTGYSSLSFLNSLPFDRIKIDRSFVQDLGARPEAAAIIAGVVHLCTGLGAAVTAEGAETGRQIALLRCAGCREVQGFGIARPMPLHDLRDWLGNFRGTPAGSFAPGPDAAGRDRPDPPRGDAAKNLLAETR